MGDMALYVDQVAGEPAVSQPGARQTTLRIIGWQPSADRMFSVWRTIERSAFRTGFG